jgi:hypothetical protein
MLYCVGVLTVQFIVDMPWGDFSSADCGWEQASPSRSRKDFLIE